MNLGEIQFDYADEFIIIATPELKNQRYFIHFDDLLLSDWEHYHKGLGILRTAADALFLTIWAIAYVEFR